MGWRNRWMRRYPLYPLQNQVMLAHSSGIAQRLMLALAKELPNGSYSVGATLDMRIPRAGLKYCR